jgi:di/tricarboxylate transporter
MTLDAWIAVGVVALVVGLLVFTRAAADLVMAAGLTVLLTLRVVTPAEALSGFANEGVAAVAVLFVVATGLRETSAMALVAPRLLGRPRSVLAAQARLMLPLAAASAFIYNTPLVAMMLPVVDDWARRLRLPASKLMMPLSFSVILGGLCTLLGTSTNLVVSGLAVARGRPAVGLFEPAWVGVPCCLAGLAYLLLSGRRLLPDRRPPLREPEDPRNYTVEMLVEPAAPSPARPSSRPACATCPACTSWKSTAAVRCCPRSAPTPAWRPTTASSSSASSSRSSICARCAA